MSTEHPGQANSPALQRARLGDQILLIAILISGAAAAVLEAPRHIYSQELMRSALSGQATPAVESPT